MKAFTAALETMGKAPFSIGKIPPTPMLVDQYLNESTGAGEARPTLAVPGMRAAIGKLSRFPN
jgi:Mn-containing catalase